MSVALFKLLVSTTFVYIANVHAYNSIHAHNKFFLQNCRVAI